MVQWLNFFGSEDVGVGPGEERAKHAMVFFVIALNSDWKIPPACFLLPDTFNGNKSAELLRQAALN